LAHPLTERLATALSQRPEVLEGYLFGSLARGEAQPHSDIDVAVFIDRSRLGPQPFGYAAELASDLMKALGRSELDVVVLNDAPPLLYHRVLRDGIRVTSRDLRATTTREGYALSRYCDWVPQLEKIRAVQEARIRSGEFGR
jgi:predicted nucleotidyltransferase